MKFEWDSRKAVINQEKHEVSFTDAASVFRDALSMTYPDTDHSDEEDRFLILGSSSSGSILVVSHTFRGETIRIISARNATKKERSFYEQQSSH